MILLYIKYFLLTALIMFGLIGLVRGTITGMVTLIQGIRSRDWDIVKRAIGIFVLSFLCLLLVIYLWPLVDTNGN